METPENGTPVLLSDVKCLCCGFIWNYFLWWYRAKTDNTVSKLKSLNINFLLPNYIKSISHLQYDIRENSTLLPLILQKKT